MWLVRSKTEPPLPHTATLAKFINTNRVSPKVMISNMTLSVILILIAESKQAIPIELASDRQSLDFYQFYKLSNYSNSGLVFST